MPQMLKTHNTSITLTNDIKLKTRSIFKIYCKVNVIGDYHEIFYSNETINWFLITILYCIT